MTDTESHRDDGSDGLWPDIMTIPEIAAYLRIEQETARELCRAGKLRAAKPTGGPRTPWVSRRAWVDAYLDGLATGGTVPARKGLRAPAVAA